MAKPCSVEGCEKPAQCRTWCAKHYRRWLNHGTIELVPRTALMGSLAVCEATGISFRQLIYWQQVGAVTATEPGVGSGHYTGWSEDDCARLVRIGRVIRSWRQWGAAHDNGSVAFVERLWKEPLDEVVVIEGDGCRLIVEP